MSDSEDEQALFQELWQRESQPVLEFEVAGVGKVVQAQDLLGERWKVCNFSNTVWEAAIFMHHYFQELALFPVGHLRGKRVLELGAGTGLVGLTLSLLGADVMLTDLEEGLPILEHNTAATFRSLSQQVLTPPPAGGAAGREGGGGEEGAQGPPLRPTLEILEWGRPTPEAVTTGGDFDMVVGADIFYSEATFVPLAATLRRVCSETTVLHMATLQRGGGHTRLLDMLSDTFEFQEVLCASSGGVQPTEPGPDESVGAGLCGETGLARLPVVCTPTFFDAVRGLGVVRLYRARKRAACR